MCPAVQLANRQLFAFFVRLILVFRILPPAKKEDAMILDAMEANACITGLLAEPKMFKCRFQIRNKNELDCWLESSSFRNIKKEVCLITVNRFKRYVTSRAKNQ